MPIGKPYVPEIVFGFGASVGYKNIDISFFFQGAGNTSFFVEPNAVTPFINERNVSVITNNNWSENNPIHMRFGQDYQLK